MAAETQTAEHPSSRSTPVSPWRLTVFVVIELLLSPFSLVGGIAYIVRLKLVNQARGISGTAYEPFMARAMGHGVGARSDLTSYRLASTLPALTPLTAALLLGPTNIAARLSGHVPTLLGGRLERPVGIMSVMGLRNAFFDEAVADAMANVRQVVILGSAWDTRAYEQLRDWGHPIYEVDLPPTLQAKIAALDKAGIDRGHVTFVETDFDQTSWLDALKARGFDAAEPTFVLWEGVTMYLTEDAVRATLATVSEFAPGSRIAFDYFAREFVDGEGAYRLVSFYGKLSVKLTYGEEFRFGIAMRPNAREVVAGYLASNGLNLSHFDMIGTDGKLMALYGFAVATP